MGQNSLRESCPLKKTGAQRAPPWPELMISKTVKMKKGSGANSALAHCLGDRKSRHCHRIAEMNFTTVIATLSRRLDAQNVHYALIGGFAMALRGVQRATMDLDFLLMLEDLKTADAILVELGYRREFHSENVSHYLNRDEAWGRIDILHAFRGPSLGMLRRAERLPVSADLTLPVLAIEDIIGLKIQAVANDPGRAISDWHDIGLLLSAAREQGVELDWELLADYLRLFGFESKLPELKSIHGAA